MPIALRTDFDAAKLRGFTKGTKDGPQARQLLALAAIYDGASRTEAMNLHLAEIAAEVTPGAHAVVILDQAGWHMSNRLNVPANITLIPLPPKCPELNLVENVWQFMRDNLLSNRVFTSYDNLVDHWCDAWNSLVDQPWRIRFITAQNAGLVP